MIKRVFDVLCAVAGLVVLAPLMVAIAIAVRLTSRGPAIHRARRVGRDGVPFELLKFRSMYLSPAGGAAITRAGDPRVTPLGRVLRKTKLDELPQLVNVLRGEMSMVGPRPEDFKYVALYDTEQQKVLAVRPGITSAASLQYRDEEAQLVGERWEEKYVGEIMPAKLRIDQEYLARATFLSDLSLVVRTLLVLFRRERPRRC